jgi:hypothetical protein
VKQWVGHFTVGIFAPDEASDVAVVVAGTHHSGAEFAVEAVVVFGRHGNELGRV